jgi:hypothetical protein
VAAERSFSHLIGRLSHSSFCGACRLVLENSLGRLHIFRQVASILESMEVMALGEGAITQCVCTILELAPYKSKRCLIPCGRDVERIALLILVRMSRVHARCALRHRDAVRAVPRYPPDSWSSFEMIGIGVLPTRMLATRARRAVSRSALRFISCRS